MWNDDDDDDDDAEARPMAHDPFRPAHDQSLVSVTVSLQPCRAASESYDAPSITSNPRPSALLAPQCLRRVALAEPIASGQPATGAVLPRGQLHAASAAGKLELPLVASP
ncbi:hypothetical protein AC579_9396 [Pseudocercospora musae]|uniref:Uncharacterized protein n=1 Tax=Pseudocercospora musae TaxID=113226 RepID=A0A139I3P7_9PEZI|nr:hypothetical protein AC579_9396 [Pseudocercospora musae]